MKKPIQLLFLLSGFMSCSDDNSTKMQSQAPTQPQTPSLISPLFNADSAYSFIQTQVDFGPRFPGSPGHKKCADWLAETFARFADKVTVQDAEVKNFDGKKLKIKNIVASFNPDAKERVFVSAHWDSRPYADKDPNAANHNTPILAADDGGSGIGVMLEMARLMAAQKPGVGVDLICFDAEDLGKPEYEDSYCLGSQYWARKPHLLGYKARFGVNLDMVGGRDARFVWEGFSRKYAEPVLRKLWDIAVQLGYSNHYFYYEGGAITDDHYYVNKLAGIPTIDIIHYAEQTSSGFPAHWHTLNDNMSVIDRNTLKAVGQPVLELIYREKS